MRSILSSPLVRQWAGICLLLPALVLCISTEVTAQVKIGNNPGTINASALLEMESTNQGLLLPRVSLTGTTSASPLAAHVAGMVVFNIATAGASPNNVTPGYYFNSGTAWVRLVDTNTQPWFDQVTKTGAMANTQNVYQMGKVGVGTNEPGLGTVEIKPIGTEEPLLLCGGNVAGEYGRSQISFGWNDTHDYRHSIRTRHDTGSPLQNAIEFYLWNNDIDTYGGRTKESLGSLHVMSLLGDGSLQVGKGVRLSPDRGVRNPKAPWEYATHFPPSITMNPVVGAGIRQFSQIMNGNDDMLLFRGADRTTDGTISQTNTRDFAQFDTRAPAGSLIMNASGNIGIGNTAPQNNLQIGKGIGLNLSKTEFPTLLLNPEGSGGSRQVKMLVNGTNDLFTLQGADRTTEGNVSTTNSTNFVQFNAKAPSSSLVMDVSGNIGLGTGAPQSNLQIVNGLWLSAKNTEFPSITLNPIAGAGSRQVTIAMGGANDLFTLQGAGRTIDGSAGANTKNFVQFDTNAPASSLTMSASGNIGIGTNSPTEKLEVNGNIKAASLVTSSDRRLKTNIRPVIHAGELVNKLNPVHYIKTSPGSREKPRKEYGFIAQEIRELLPELVSGTETDSTYLSMHYTSLIAILTSALQEQQAETAALTKALQQQHTHTAALTKNLQEQQAEMTVLKDQMTQLTTFLNQQQGASTSASAGGGTAKSVGNTGNKK